jgi:hypothetical protein
VSAGYIEALLLLGISMQTDILKVARAIQNAERILIITGAGLSADSGLPTYRGLGGSADRGSAIRADAAA